MHLMHFILEVSASFLHHACADSVKFLKLKLSVRIISCLHNTQRLQILGGYVLDAFLTPWTLLIKSLGLALAVASGLSLGKEVGVLAFLQL